MPRNDQCTWSFGGKLNFIDGLMRFIYSFTHVLHYGKLVGKTCRCEDWKCSFSLKMICLHFFFMEFSEFSLTRENKTREQEESMREFFQNLGLRGRAHFSFINARYQFYYYARHFTRMKILNGRNQKHASTIFDDSFKKHFHRTACKLIDSFIIFKLDSFNYSVSF